MTTARDLITSALEDVGVIGVGQTPLADDLNGGLTRLNRMLSQWQRRRWMCWHLVDVTCMSTDALSYTVGPGGNFNVMRPDRIESAFARQLSGGQSGSGSDFNADFGPDFGGSDVIANPITNPIDYPLYIIQARETYNEIYLKSMRSWPQYVFYDSAFPLGNLFIYPVPQAGQFELHLSLKEQLQQPANLSTVFAMPPEYDEAMEYNLAIRLCNRYQIDVPTAVQALAQASMDLIRSANTQIPLLDIPDELTGSGNYNIYSDQFT